MANFPPYGRERDLIGGRRGQDRHVQRADDRIRSAAIPKIVQLKTWVFFWPPTMARREPSGENARLRAPPLWTGDTVPPVFRVEEA